jgi:hypothetical protein
MGKMTGTAVLLACGLLIAACASSGGMSRADRLALYRQHAGPPVQSFRLDRFHRFYRWTPLGDEAIAVWTSGSQGHLLEFRSRCTGLGLSHSITISNQMGRVNARFDSVQPRTGPTATQRACRIWTIRPLDGRTLRDAKREMREASLIDRPADVVPEEE